MTLDSHGPPGSPALAAQDLRFAYPGGDGFGLHAPSFELAARERLALIGPSGGGKTTMLHLLAGILVPSSGRVFLGSQGLSDQSEALRRARRVAEIGLVFQEFELLDYLSAGDNILLPYRIAPSLRLTGEVRERARSLAQAAGIGACLDRRPAQLSQGQRQRVALCRALVTRPKVVLADEPTGNLDPETAATVRGILFEQCAQAGAALLVVTHDRAHLDEFDRVIDVQSWITRPQPSA